MPGNLAIPTVFLGHSPSPISALDNDLATIAAYINIRELGFGTLALRPAAGTAGRFYFATDTLTLYGDTGVAWTPIGLGQTGITESFSGLGLSNNAGDAVNDIDIAVGAATSDDAAIANRIVMSLTAGMTKELDVAWALGTNTGMRASGAAIANTTYHIFLIERPDTGAVDIAADTSATGANLAANTAAAFTKKRRIGSILREAGAIVAFVQDADLFQRKASVLDVDADNPGVGAVSRTLSVPLGIQVRAIVNVEVYNNAGAVRGVYLSDLDVNDEAASMGSAAVTPLITMASGASAGEPGGGGPFEIRTSLTGQIRSRMDNSEAGTKLKIATLGWIDRRGRG